jgi:hypothetical protein
MITDKIKALAAHRARITKLERLIEKGLPRELATLPGMYGFTNVGLFARAVKAAASKRGRPPKTTTQVKRGKRVKITDAIRAKVRKLVKAGKTGSAIANSLKISLPSVQNVKKALGLVRTAKKPTLKPKVRRAPAKHTPVQKLRKKRISPKKQAATETISS